MKKFTFRLLLLLPLFSNSQDTLFNKKLSEVTVRSTNKRSTETSVVSIIRNLSTISDGISIEYIKKTPDRSVSDALKRISGVTIQNDKFVLVRGLTDRYNTAWVNKSTLPSTEPDRRSFTFDIIPTSVIDNIVVIKSLSANLPGDWSGGLVQVSTKEVSETFQSLSLGSSIGTASTFRDFYKTNTTYFPTTFPSTYAYRISSNGDKRLYTKQIKTHASRNIFSVPNVNGSVSLGYKKDSWSGIFSVITRNNFSINYVNREDYQSSTELSYKYKDTIYTQTLSTNGLLNITKLDKNRYNWKTLFSYQNQNVYLTRQGRNYDNIQDVSSSSTNHINNLLFNTQVDGKIKNVDFIFGYNYTFREQPDYKVNPLSKSLGSNETYSIPWRDTYRFWSIMDENSFNAGINYVVDNIKLGTSYTKRIRNFNARVFRYTSNDILDEITNNTDKYSANFDLGSSYLMYEKQINKVKVNTGIRTEYNYFEVKTANFSGQKVNVNRSYLDVLPSINLTYQKNKSQFRFSSSKSLSRPEFREVSNFAYYDFIRNAQVIGNANLEKTDIYNVDIKYEYYPKLGENVSVSFFGKKFIRPIELVVDNGSVPSNLLLSYTNAKSADLFGIEFEFRKKINKWLDVYTNCSFINSEVNENNIKRPLQGQSNYILNGGLNIKKDKNLLNISYNRIGNRISAVGFQGYPDVYENSRDLLDITLLRKIKNGEIKVSFNDVLSQPTILYQKYNNRKLIITNNETIASVTLNLNL